MIDAALLAAALTLTHVSVVDVDRGRVRHDVTVRVPSDADRTVDATGKFLIPGLWDMHVHLPDDRVGRDAYLKLFLANGVTGIRVMEGSPELYRWRDAITHNTLLGPRMVVASAILDGPAGYLPDAVKVSTPEEARAAVRNAKEQGADFIKVYDNLSAEAYAAIVAEARRQRLPVAGHVPLAMSAAGVARAGQTTIEHMMGIASDAALYRTLRAHGTWECPTLIMRWNYAHLDEPGLANDERLQYVKPTTRARWLKMLGEGTAERKAIVARELTLAGELAKAGVGILARVPLASGLLTGRYDESTTFPPDDHRNFNRHGEAFDVGETFAGVPYEVGVAAAREVREIAGDTSTAAFALRWVIDQPGVTSVIPGARSVEQVRGNVAAATLPPLTATQLSDLERLYDERIRAHVHDRW
jgi:hypothetical protein